MKFLSMRNFEKTTLTSLMNFRASILCKVDPCCGALTTLLSSDSSVCLKNFILATSRTISNTIEYRVRASVGGMGRPDCPCVCSSVDLLLSSSNDSLVDGLLPNRLTIADGRLCLGIGKCFLGETQV